MLPSPLKPLRGVRVLSLALNLPGPGALMRLRAMGASCLKIEPPGPGGVSGDPMGQYNPTAYAQMHQGIKLRTLDLKTDKGQAGLHKELARTDVLIVSFRPSALRKLGLLGKNASSIRWLRKHPEAFELSPASKPNKVRLRD